MPSLKLNNLSSPFDGLQQNMKDVDRLLKIHEEQTGINAGRRYKVAVLNKSGVVLITACWEAFIEDVVTTALEFIMNKISSEKKLPEELQKIVAQHLRNHKHELKVWDLAGRRWKSTAAEILKLPVDRFHNPTSNKIDELFKKALDLKEVSENWCWRSMSKKRASERLDDYVNRRHDIAHRVKTDKVVSKEVVKAYATHVRHLAEITSNKIRDHVYTITGKNPWDEANNQATE